MLKSLTTKMVPPCFERELNWDQQNWSADFGQRLTVLTGDNGLGKTVLLELIWYALTFTWFGKPVDPYRAFKTSLIRDKAFATPPSTEALQTQDSSIIANLVCDGKNVVHSAQYDFEHEDWSHIRPETAISGIVIFAGANGAYSVWDSDRTPLVDGKYQQSPMWASNRNSRIPDW